MDSGREREHLLALKVMRLTKPTFVSNPCILQCDTTRDLPLDTFNNLTKSDVTVLNDLQQFALSEVLTLPQNFGNIFLGETFSSYISIHNDSKQTCKEVSVKTDLQTSSKRITLTSSNPPHNNELQPDCSIDEVIHHEVKELGTHILVCAVSYTNALEEKLYFRKFFKFHVLKPLDVKTKFYHTEEDIKFVTGRHQALNNLQQSRHVYSVFCLTGFAKFSYPLERADVESNLSDDVYLEAQIQNITPGPIYLERVPLEPSPLYNVKEFQSEPIVTTGKVTVVARETGARYLGPLDIHQYLYCLSPRPEAGADMRLLKGVTTIGKLDIVWRTNMGEKGRLQTSPLERVAPGSGDVKVTVESIAQAVPVGQVFPVRIKVVNCCEQRTMDLQLSTNNSHVTGLLWTGLCGRSVGTVNSCAHVFLDLHLIAIRTGLLTVSGLRLTDTFLRRTYELDELAQVFVYDNVDSSGQVLPQPDLLQF